MKSSADLCTDLGIKDVDLEWSEADYQNLITFSIFARMVRPQLMAVSSYAVYFIFTCILFYFNTRVLNKWLLNNLLLLLLLLLSI